MGIRNYLIEGVSGTGKTTVAEELQRRVSVTIDAIAEADFCSS